MTFRNDASHGHIIVVDDEMEIMTVLCEILSRKGYEIKGFTSAREALRALRQQDFDVLLTDLMMPEMDGITLLKKGWEIDSALMGIIMTSHDSLRTAEEARGIGAFDYILKPFRLDSLLPVLSQAVRVRYVKKMAQKAGICFKGSGLSRDLFIGR
jgi:DNA-binding NtrC family response regulator